MPPARWSALCPGRHGLRLLAAALLLIPVLAGATDRLRVAVISDLNGSYGSTTYEASVDAAVERIIELRPDLVISTGDMVAGQRRPHLTRAEIEAMWRAFHARVSGPLAEAGIPLAVTPGNHDASAYPGFEAERRIYAAQWADRRPQVRFIDDAHYPFHYAFAAGGVLFISLDATTVGVLPAGQMDWLAALLARHGADYDRRVVFSHMPVWPVARGREREYIGDPELERLLRRAQVDLYLSGHHHAFYPGHREGVNHLHQACLGAGPRRLIGTEATAPRVLTLIELDEAGIEVAALTWPGFRQTLDWESLPRSIAGGPGVLTRADLAAGGVRPLTGGAIERRAEAAP